MPLCHARCHLILWNTSAVSRPMYRCLCRYSSRQLFAVCPDSCDPFARAPPHHARRRFRVDRPPRANATIAAVGAHKPPRLLRPKTKPHVLPAFDCPVVATHLSDTSQFTDKHTSTKQQGPAGKCLAVAGERSRCQWVGRWALNYFCARDVACQKQTYQHCSHFITT